MIRTTTPRLLTALAAASTLALAACAENGADTVETETAGLTESDTGLTSATATETTAVEPPQSEIPIETVTTTQTGEEPVGELPMEPVGSEVTIAGEQATVCIYGDGWGTNVWAANANTSCELVSEVHNKIIDGLDPTRDNIRENLPEEIMVTSPVTGEDYTMACVPRGDRLVTCSGGEGAAVHFY